MQKILEKRSSPQGTTEYFIYWKGWSDCQTWETADTLQKGGAGEILAEFNNRHNPMKPPPKKKKKTSD